MALSSTTSRVTYAGNGVTTAFSFPYYFLADADLVIIETVVATGVATVKTITTHYTVSGAGADAGGTVTMIVATPTGTTLTIYRDNARTQDLNLVENDPMPAEEIEERLDKAMMIDQRLANRLDRAVRLPEGFVASFDPLLPADLAINGANTVPLLNGTATGFAAASTWPTADEIINAAGDASDAAASALAAAASAVAADASADAAAASAVAADASADAAAVSEANAAATLANAAIGVASAVDSEIALFSGTGGKQLKRATGSGFVKATSGVMSTAANVNAATELTGTTPVANGGTGAATHTANSVLVGAGTSAITSIAPGTSGNVLTSNGTTWASTAPAASSAPTSEVQLITGSGHGSTNTKIRTFSTIQKNNGGADLTIAQSATNGDSVTVNTTGTYEVFYSDGDSATTIAIGVSRNATGADLTTNINALTPDKWVCGISLPLGMFAAVSRTLRLTAGDVLRPHDLGTCDQTNRATFSVIRIS